MLNPEKIVDHTYAVDPALFRSDLAIRIGTDVVRFGDYIRPFQDRRFRAMDPAYARLTGSYSGHVAHRFSYDERPRGHSKTTDIAASILHPLLFSPRPTNGIIAAGDEAQAGLTKRAVAMFVQCNDLLQSRIEIQRNCILNTKTKSRVDIISGDAATSWGHLVDFIICDELTVWPDAGEELFYSLYSAAEKTSHTIFEIISNAGRGVGDSWQWRVYEHARTNPQDWFFQTLDGPDPHFMDAEKLDRQRQIMPPSHFNRVCMNIWASGMGDALDPETIDAAFSGGHTPMFGNEAQFGYVAGLDLSTRRDKSALCILGFHWPTGRVKLAHLQTWPPGIDGRVDLQAIEQFIVREFEAFGFTLFCDPWQAELMAQRLIDQGVPVEAFPFTGPNLNLMARVLIEVFRERRIDLYPHDELRRDLSRLSIKETGFGNYKLVAPRDKHSHCDAGVALSIALPFASTGAATGHRYMSVPLLDRIPVGD